ncbi:flavodoxin family protein [Solibacillus cecembensis]|uniref:flavodoxin family protein n=1 Tax=Solibacillus cecembensis TaxID=459347 RepID=UPI00071737BC
MKKIFAYVGSRNVSSNTLIQTRKILAALEMKFPGSFDVELYTPNELKIKSATGCKSCFTHGTCPIEQQNIDDSKLLKEKLEEADFIIFASPVYSHNVSADMKAVVERLSYWGHLFKLAGKSGVVLAVADSNGVTFVSDYMEKVFGIMGLNIIDKLNVTSTSPLSQIYVENLAEEIFNYVMGNYEIEVDERVERSFQHYKKMYATLPRSFAEPKYWHENGMFECENLQEYIEVKKGILKN